MGPHLGTFFSFWVPKRSPLSFQGPHLPEKNLDKVVFFRLGELKKHPGKPHRKSSKCLRGGGGSSRDTLKSYYFTVDFDFTVVLSMKGYWSCVKLVDHAMMQLLIMYKTVYHAVIELLIMYEICWSSNDRLLIMDEICLSCNDRLLIMGMICLSCNDRLLIIGMICLSCNDRLLIMEMICLSCNDRLLIMGMICWSCNDRGVDHVWCITKSCHHESYRDHYPGIYWTFTANLWFMTFATPTNWIYSVTAIRTQRGLQKNCL